MSLAFGNLTAIALGGFFCAAACGQVAADTNPPPAILHSRP
jgi:small ligand-binding sensory domain FIST